MKRTLRVSLIAGALALVLSALPVNAQQPRRSPSAPSSGTRANALAGLPLPASDAVVIVELRRLLSEALPRALAADPARLAEVNADIESFKTKTGIDPRSFDTLAAGSRFTLLPSGAAKLDHTVAVARGTFSPGAIVAAGRVASKGSYREHKHGGKSVYVFDLYEQVKLFGLLNVQVSKLAVAELDAKTLAVGEPDAVFAAIDAAAGRGALKASDLAVLSQPLSASTLVAFGGKAPAEIMNRIEFGNPEITKSVASIREFYGAIGTTPTGFDFQTTLRTLSAGDAKNLGDTLVALKQFAPILLSRLSGDKARVARNAVESLQVAFKGNEVQLRLEIPQGDVTALVHAF